MPGRVNRRGEPGAVYPGVCGEPVFIRPGVDPVQACGNLELSAKKLEYAKAQLELVEAYLRDLDEADKRDQGRLDKPFALDISKEKLPDVAELKRRIAFHEQNLRIMEETGESQLLFTDPQARIMRMKDDSSHAAYNIQTATDTKNHLIVAFDVTHETDMG